MEKWSCKLILPKNIAEHIKQQTSDKSCVNHLPNSVYSQKISENSVSGLENALKSRIAQNHMSPEKALYSLNSHERHVSPDLQNRLNNKFGADMHGIRIFEDDQLHEDFGQRAYAKGNEIHISNGEYSPDTPSGLELIMHEAGHVIQQGSGMVHSHGITENPALEAQADRRFIAPSSFSMPTVSDSSPIQGWAPWDKFKNIILRSMGYQSGMRKEVFNNIVMNRAAKMKKLADSGDKEAISFMKDIGLSKKENEDGKGETFSLQGIAEKLGMENNDTWENQLEQSKKYRIYDRSNPFLPKTTGGV